MPFVFLCDLGVSLFLCVEMARDHPFRADREAVVFVSRRRRGFVSGGPGKPEGLARGRLSVRELARRGEKGTQRQSPPGDSGHAGFRGCASALPTFASSAFFAALS